MKRIRGRRISLAAGAIGTPAILIRSGIGPEGRAVDLGIQQLVELPGVGANLLDHPVTRLLLVPKPGSCDLETPLAQVVLRYTAPGSDEFNDMQQVIFSHVDLAAIGGEQAVAAVGAPLAIGLPVALERPRAGAGSRLRVRIRVSTAGRARFRRRPGGPASARGWRPPRLANCARAGDRPTRRPRGAAHRGNGVVRTRHSRLTSGRPWRRSSIRAAPPAWARRTTRWPWSTSIAGSAPSTTCTLSTRRSCRPSRAPTSTSPAS